MKGFPKFVNTMQDLHNLATDLPSETKAYLEGLLLTKDHWFTLNELDADDEGLTDEIHRVLKQETHTASTEGDPVIKYLYQELREDPNGALYRLGFTSSQAVREYIDSIA